MKTFVSTLFVITISVVLGACSYTLIPDTTALDSNAEVREKFASMPHDAVLVVATLDDGYDYMDQIFDAEKKYTLYRCWFVA